MPRMNDIRIKKTRHAIHRAFFEELEEKPFAAISIAELAHRAEIGKATFYNHYTDKYDLAQQLIVANLTRLIDMVIARPHSRNAVAGGEPFSAAFLPVLTRLRLLSRIHTQEVDFEALAKAQFAQSFRRQLRQRSVLLTYAREVSSYLAELAYRFFITTINAEKPLAPQATHQQLSEFMLALQALQTTPTNHHQERFLATHQKTQRQRKQEPDY